MPSAVGYKPPHRRRPRANRTPYHERPGWTNQTVNTRVEKIMSFDPLNFYEGAPTKAELRERLAPYEKPVREEVMRRLEERIQEHMEEERGEAWLDTASDFLAPELSSELESAKQTAAQRKQALTQREQALAEQRKKARQQRYMLYGAGALLAAGFAYYNS